MPNLANAPRYAISSHAIWPVDRNATDSGPCCSKIDLNRAVNVRSASSHDTSAIDPSGCRNLGCVARSGLSSTRSASQPFGQAIPRFTGYDVSGVSPTASPSRRCTRNPHPVLQYPQGIVVVASARIDSCVMPSP